MTCNVMMWTTHGLLTVCFVLKSRRLSASSRVQWWWDIFFVRFTSDTSGM